MSRFLSRKWVLRAGVALFVAAIAGPVLYRVADRWRAQRTLDRVMDRLDRDDPGWPLDDLVRATNARLPPDDRNPFALATEANALMPAEYQKRFLDFGDGSQGRPNEMLDPAAKAKLAAAFEGFEPAADVARGLADLPDDGGNVIVMPPNPIDRRMDREQDLRATATLLRADARLLAEAGDLDGAVRSVRAGLGAARALGDDPSSIGQLIRIALAAVACRSAETVLNLGEPGRGLAELQADLLREADAPRLLVAMRGERATVSQTFEFIEAGGGAGGGLGLVFNRRADWACSLDTLTRYVEAAKLPPGERAAALRAVPLPADGDPRYLMTNLMMPAVHKVAAACTRGQGELAAVAAGVACERYRRRFGKWPNTLDDIPKDILAAVPIDPCDGQPVKYRRNADHVVVYSVGPDGVDHGGDLRDATKRDDRDYGVRLYDVSHRRKPATPTPPTPEP